MLLQLTCESVEYRLSCGEYEQHQSEEGTGLNHWTGCKGTGLTEVIIGWQELLDGYWLPGGPTTTVTLPV